LDTQLLFFVAQGLCVVAHDRRSHGRSTQMSDDVVAGIMKVSETTA
jgi:alpha-beta hydrolase superfamily lysophospholipase